MIEAASAPNGTLIKQLAAQAATATPSQIQAFKPRRIHVELVGVLIAGYLPLDLDGLAGAIGRKTSAVRHILRDPASVNWIVSQVATRCKLGLAALYARLLKEAHTSRSPKWMEMFLKRFDPEYSPSAQVTPSTTNNTQVNVYSGWTTEELQAFVRDKRQKVIGEVANG